MITTTLALWGEQRAGDPKQASRLQKGPGDLLCSADFRQICATWVDVRGVDEIHTGVRRLVEDPKGLGFIGLFAECSCA